MYIKVYSFYIEHYVELGCNCDTGIPDITIRGRSGGVITEAGGGGMDDVSCGVRESTDGY